MTVNFDKLRAVFQEALEKHAPESWHKFVSEVTEGDEELYRQVCQLLEAHAHGGSLLDRPAVAAVPTIDQPIAEKPGAVIGPYKLLQQIGEGGMGVVYMAEQTEPVARRVALKIIKPGMDTRQVIARFEAERQALAVMDHPNIAKVFDAGTTSEVRDQKSEIRKEERDRSPLTSDLCPLTSGSGRPYFVMELVKGVPITQYCDEHQLTPRERLELFVPVCQAVQHAHQKGIIHRDIKPSNVLVAEYDDRPVPKVIDFGVAKAIEQRLTEKSMFTQFGQVVGTIDYMSPEQAKLNQLDIDTRSDIYSLGVLLYELLTGETPLDRERLRSAAFDEMLRIIREEEPPKPSVRLSSSQSLPSIAANRQIEPKKLSTLVRGELDWIVMKALEKDRTGRYETANGFAQDIERYLSDEPVQACPPSAVYRFKKFARRNKAGLVLATVIGVALLLVVGVFGWTVRDRVARQARVSEQVELILEEVGRFEQEQKWPEALTAAKRAEAVLGSGEATEDLQASVRQVVADLEMVERVEEIRLLSSEIREQDFDYEGTNRQYAVAFREYGVDLDALPADEAAAWLRSRAGVLPALIVAMDDWAKCRREVKNEAGAKTLTNVAQALDTDPWRRRVREALAAKSEKALGELAGSEEVACQAPTTVGLVARTLEKNGKPERALEVLSRALREHPEDFWLHLGAAQANFYCRPPRYDEAVRHCTVALALRPRSVAVLNDMGVCLNAQKRADEAIACYRKAIELNPKYALAHSNLGKALEEQGKLDESIASCRKAIELDPKYAAAHYNLGKALEEQGKPDEAIACYRNAIELDPKLAVAHNNLGKALADQGKLDEAITSCRKAIELDPKLAHAHYNLGRARGQQGKLAEVIACYRKAVELDPKFALAHFGLGYALKDQGKLDEAIACYRKAIELDPKYAAVHNNLGNALVDQGKLDEAMACHRKAIELDPKFAVAHSNLGVVLAGRGKLDEAIACHRKAIELDPKSANAHNKLALALKDQGKLEEAVGCWRKAIEVDPKSSMVHNNLAWFLATADDMKLRNPKEALELARKAVQLDPKPWHNWNTLSVAAYRAGDWKTSLDARQEKLRRRPIGAEDRFFLAMTHWQLGDKTQARKSYDEAFSEIAKQKTPGTNVTKLRQEAEQLLGITSSPTPPDRGKPRPEKPRSQP